MQTDSFGTFTLKFNFLSHEPASASLFTVNGNGLDGYNACIPEQTKSYSLCGDKGGTRGSRFSEYNQLVS